VTGRGSAEPPSSGILLPVKACDPVFQKTWLIKKEDGEAAEIATLRPCIMTPGRGDFLVCKSITLILITAKDNIGAGVFECHESFATY